MGRDVGLRLGVGRGGLARSLWIRYGGRGFVGKGCGCGAVGEVR